MNKLLILLSTILVVKLSGAISLGDTLNETVAAQKNTTTSALKLVEKKSTSSKFQSTSADGKAVITYLVNNKSNKVYSISWQDSKATNLQEILGSTYYAKFAASKTKKRIPFRGVNFDDNDLVVTQFGSMLSGVQGAASVKSLAPEEE
ncbi:MAG: hypothetical protein K0R14_1193 [Burkholderiales bacterium]|jgi:hypothetical protein|nr:hypothetical protein [Burkholderiales bacterium]